MRELQGTVRGVLAVVFLLAGHSAFGDGPLLTAAREGDITTLELLLNG